MGGIVYALRVTAREGLEKMQMRNTLLCALLALGILAIPPSESQAAAYDDNPIASEVLQVGPASIAVESPRAVCEGCHSAGELASWTVAESAHVAHVDRLLRPGDIPDPSNRYAYDLATHPSSKIVAHVADFLRPSRIRLE